VTGSASGGPEFAGTPNEFAVTGHPRVDEAVAALAAAQDAPAADQVAPLADAHRILRETLDSIGDI
jgi:hypothetical protein